MGVFSFIAQGILEQINFWSSIGNQLVAAVTGIVLTGATIQMMWHGFNVMRGAGGGNYVLELLAKSARVFLVMTLALAGSAYSDNVVGTITDLRDGLTNLFNSNAVAGASSYAALDASVDKATVALRNMLPWVSDNTNILVGNFTGLIGLAGMALMVGLIVIYAGLSAVNFLLIDFGFQVIWAVGPLFVACFAFESTARFFDAWLGAALKYAFTAVVMSAVLGIGMGILDGYCTRLATATDASSVDFIAATVGAIGAMGVLVVFSSRASEVAGNIVGGIGISAMGPAMAAGPLAAMGSLMGKTAAGAARVAANSMGYGAGVGSQTGAGRAIASAAGRVTNSAPVQKALEIARAAGRVGSTIGNMKPGSVGAAYDAGAGRSVGLGSITGGRPLGASTSASMGN
jgi:type IV secretion system protein VirB6